MTLLEQAPPPISLTSTSALVIAIVVVALVAIAAVWFLTSRARNGAGAGSRGALLGRSLFRQRLLQNRVDLRAALQRQGDNRPLVAVVADVFPVTVMLLFLLLGIVCAWLGPMVAPWLSQHSSQPISPANGWTLVVEQSFRPADGPSLTEELPLRDYSQIILFSRTISPTNGTALVTLYGERSDGAQEQKRLTVDETWSIWELPNTFTRMKVGVTPQGNTPATEVRVQLYARK